MASGFLLVSLQNHSKGVPSTTDTPIALLYTKGNIPLLGSRPFCHTLGRGYSRDEAVHMKAEETNKIWLSFLGVPLGLFCFKGKLTGKLLCCRKPKKTLPGAKRPGEAQFFGCCQSAQA